MELYSQRDPRWKDITLGFGTTTIGSHGCKMTCFSIITGIDPRILNEKFKKDGCFLRDLLIDSKIAISLEIAPNSTTSINPKEICVAEVDMSPSPGKQQHFVVWIGDGTIIDPWTGTIRPGNTYPLINFRVFNFDKYLSDMKPTKDLAREYKELLGKDCGDNMNDNEQDDFAKEIKKLREKPTPPAQNCDVYKQEIEDLKVELTTANARITELEPKADIGNRFMEVTKMANSL